MRRDILREAVQLNMEHRRRKWWHQIVSAMAAVVVFVTTYALILPAITMEQETVCGLNEHTHSDACYYVPVLKVGKDYACPLVLHTHDSNCYDENHEIICGYADFAVHTHNKRCVDEQGFLICNLPEHMAHEHQEECYLEESLYQCGLEEGDGGHTHDENCWSIQKLICEQIESDGHSHAENCYSRPLICRNTIETIVGAHHHTDECYRQPVLICQHEEAATSETGVGEEATQSHQHIDECYNSPELICQIEESTGSVIVETAPDHTHGEECYGSQELTCDIAEAPAHTHTDLCYAEKVLLCTQTEAAGHTHDESCAVEITRKLICQQPEIVLHRHDENCFDDYGKPICGSVQIEAHQHDDDCFVEHVHTEACYHTDEMQTVLTCPYHTHEDTCYDESGLRICDIPVLICGMQEHVHQESCYPEVEDGLTELLLQIPAELEPFIQSESEFPVLFTLEEGSCIGSLPALTVTNPDEENPVYLQDYHWVTADGYPVDENTLITEDTVLTLQLYPADHPGAARLVTATFVAGDEVLLSRKVIFGTIASELIHNDILQKLDEIKKSDLRFEGWLYTDTDGEEDFLETGVTAVEADTVYHAVFREYVTVTLHDLDPDGNEYSGGPYQIVLPLGDNLASRQLILSDGTAVSDCQWYTAEGEPFAPDAPISESLHLYTYSYTLLLDLQKRSNSETDGDEIRPIEIDGETGVYFITTSLIRDVFVGASAESAFELEMGDHTESSENVTIVKRSGDVLTETDFVVDGVNYTAFQWEDESGNDVDANDLVGASLTANYTLIRAAAQTYSIRYKTNITQTVFGTKPTIGGEDSLEDFYSTNDGTYTVRVPNPTQYMVTSGNKRTLYTFNGWKVTRDNSVITGGEVVNATWIAQHVDRNKSYVTLTAQWTAVPLTETVHFFVNLNCQAVDVDGNTGIPNSGDFTPSVYSTTMTVTGTSMKNYWQGPINRDSYSTQYVVLRADNANETESIDARIRRLLNGFDTTRETYNGRSVWKNGYTGIKIFQVNDFPSDEQVLSVVRNMVQNGTVIRMNGVALKAEDLTSSNFTVRWNVCKYDTGDGWHIDGILVGKQAHITVKKTFLGDDAAVALIKNGDYSITLDNTTSNSASNLTLTLNPAASETSTTRYGYDAYDPATDTYTWTIPLQQDHYYSIIENNYKLNADAVQTSAAYTISNSPDAISVWTPYPDGGISNIKAYSYANDVSSVAYQTVAIRNSYVKSDTLTINKIDMDTGHGLAGISYRIGTNSGQPLVLYQKPNSSYYSMKAEDLDNGFVQTTDSVITTGNNGDIFLKLETGTFTLEEAFPTGYGGASKITVTVGVDNSGNVIFDQVSSSDSTIEVDGALVDKNTATLTIRNVSFPTSVTAEKVWNNPADAKPVTVALYRNGIDMGSSYHVVLNSSNRWKHTWDKLPLYVDGNAAQYSLREIKIDSINYDPSADNDGYSGYIVSYDEMLYRKNGVPVSGPVWIDDNGVTQYADNAHLTVRNEVYRGQMMFLKVDGAGRPLKGAIFKLYSDADQKEVVAQATSDDYGRVVFENLMPDTYYVMKETDTPNGYVGGDSLYKVRLTPQGSTTLEDASTGEVLTTVVNYLDIANVRVQKVSEFGTTLSNAQFTLEKQEDDGWIQITEGFTDESGSLEFGELRSGNYRLTEVKPPDGFMSLPEPISFTLEQGKIQFSNPNLLWSATEDVADDTIVITVINKTGYVLPNTGGFTVEAYYAAGIALILAALAVTLIKRRKGATPY